MKCRKLSYTNVALRNMNLSKRQQQDTCGRAQCMILILYAQDYEKKNIRSDRRPAFRRGLYTHDDDKIWGAIGSQPSEEDCQEPMPLQQIEGLMLNPQYLQRALG